MKAHKPRVYFPSIRHPGYEREEFIYIISHSFQSTKKRGRESLRDRTDKARQYKQRILSGWNGPKEGYAHVRFWEVTQGTFSEESARAVIDAAKEFGVDALRLNPTAENIMRNPDKFLSARLGGFDTPYTERMSDGTIRHNIRVGNVHETPDQLRYVSMVDELGAIVCEAIRLWQYEIRFGPAQVKREASRWLKALFKSLIPETRGKRGDRIVSEPTKVKFFYYSQLFRIYQIEAILRKRVKFSLPGSTEFQQGFPDTGPMLKARVQYVSEKFDVPVTQIRELWNLDDTARPKMRPMGTVSEMARVVTARSFRITQHTVSNIIAS